MLAGIHGRGGRVRHNRSFRAPMLFAGPALALALLLASCGGTRPQTESTLPKHAAATSESHGKALASSGKEEKAENAAQRASETQKGPTAARRGAPQEAGGGTNANRGMGRRASGRSASVAPPTREVTTALAQIRAGKYEAAIRTCKAALRRDEKYVPAMIAMSRAYFQLGKLEFSEAICDIALSIRRSAGACYNLKGFIALRNKDGVLARKMFKRATEVQPNLGVAWLNLGAQYLKVKNYTAAIAPLLRATRMLPNRGAAYLNLGSAYRGENQLVRAFKNYNQALKARGGRYPDAYFNLGILFLDAQNYPGMDRLQQLTTAVSYFNRYKQQKRDLSKSDLVDRYIAEAQKGYQRERKRRERDARRKAREAARKVQQNTPQNKSQNKPQVAPASKQGS